MRLIPLFGSVVALTQAPQEAEQQNAAPQANRPVAKVVKLLNEMKTTLEKEQKDDAELFEKMECWCSTNRGQKTKAVEDAQKKIADLEAAIEEYTARAAQLTGEIKGLEKDIGKNQKSLAEATALREKELAEFQAEEKELLETIDALGKAVKALGGVHGEFVQTQAFIQLKSKLTAVPSKFQDVMRKDLWDMLGSLEDEKSAKAPELSATQVFSEMFMAPKKSLLQGDPAGDTETAREENWASEDNMDYVAEKAEEQAPEDAYEAAQFEKAKQEKKENALKGGAAKGAKSYNAQSGAIFGVLKQMKEDFETKLSNARQEEADAQKRFDSMKAALLAEIAAQQKSVKNKKSELADTVQANAQAKQDVEDTTNALNADEKFLLDLEARCSQSSDEYAARQKERADEIVAVGQAIGVLTNDESRDLFSRTFNFVQVNSKASHRARERAARKILSQAKKSKNYQLAALAVSVQLDAFTKVKKAMDDMLAQLREQQKDEYEHKEFCRVELDRNEDDIKDKDKFAADTESTITDLTGQIETLTNEIEVLNIEIADTRVSIKRAGEDRAAENKEFQSTVNDQRLTVNILNKALDKLAAFYEPKEKIVSAKTALDQEPNVPGRAIGNKAPPQQKTYQKSGASGGAMGLIQMIIADAKAMEAEVSKDEQRAQSAYAEFVTNGNNSVSAAQKEIQNKTVERAQAEEAKSEHESSLQDTMNILETLHSENADLHKSCDFVVKNFDVRQEARAQEIDSIEQAKAVLSGADFS